MKTTCKLAAVVSVLAAFAFLTGCASIIHGSRQRITFDSEPSGAAVTVRDDSGSVIVSGMETPYTAKLHRGSGFFSSAYYTVKFEKAGYRTATMNISSNLSIGWYLIGNYFIGGLLGWLIIDPLTGGMWILEPEHLTAGMVKE